MSEKFTITLAIDSSLVKYFIEAGHEDEEHVAGCLIDFVADFLNDTRYPLAAKRTGEREILLKYQLRAFADPIF
ncbi:hypothetical protein SAMN02745165_00873 [Malonomonas rubra DSM 5091]|uniref:Uncharacterized protein n=1 Tax=Malonomonas rubra DSM 5091 TaxID=1122189 RepID=A0A1M6DZE6_MALRU|nr:hypothetical protein [Malonomonas rubra]SHI78632.1 hypothetical protein SAMN02745165_00873 [Malonomonas rubra DSM 5091]